MSAVSCTWVGVQGRGILDGVKFFYCSTWMSEPQHILYRFLVRKSIINHRRRDQLISRIVVNNPLVGQHLD